MRDLGFLYFYYLLRFNTIFCMSASFRLDHLCANLQCNTSNPIVRHALARVVSNHHHVEFFSRTGQGRATSDTISLGQHGPNKLDR